MPIPYQTNANRTPSVLVPMYVFMFSVSVFFFHNSMIPVPNRQNCSGIQFILPLDTCFSSGLFGTVPVQISSLVGEHCQNSHK
ncbi:hypothetical protein HanIR_Chr14g0713461 [Helianthus annuus]|nr:hypothetical protein HanIR_Chr14g0713461 [Helianthus annuus]